MVFLIVIIITIIKKIIFGGVRISLSQKQDFIIGSPLNVKYDYLCEGCYYYLAEPYNYVKINKPVIHPNNYYLMGMINIQNLTNTICRKCLKVNASYKLINSVHIKMKDVIKLKRLLIIN